MNFAGKLTSAVVAVLIFVGAAIAFIGYDVAYDQVKEAVGIELVGCANITTGLVDPAAVEKLVKGDTSGLADIETRLNWTADHKAIFKEAFLLDLNGKVLAVDKRMKGHGIEAGTQYYMDDAVKAAFKGTDHSNHQNIYSDVYEFGGEKLMTGYGPIFKDHDPNKEIIALMAINFDASIIQERTMDTVVAPVITGMIALLVGVVLIYLVIRRMVRPVVKLSAHVNRIAKGDLTVEPLDYSSKDEVGVLVNDMNGMAINLRKLIQEVNQTSVLVAASSQELTASAEQTGKASEQIALVSQDLAAGADRQLKSLEETSEIINRMSQAVQQISSNATDVTASAADTAFKAESGLHSAITAEEQMNAISFSMDELSQTVQVLGEHSKEIGSIVEVITDIAGQTNLLSLNAAIEAARAGEQGRGFAVVADSIRKLAEQSSRSAQQITGLVTVILTQMEKVALTVNSTSREVVEGAGMVHSAGEAFGTIRASATETAERIEQVSQSVSHISDGSVRLVESVKLLLTVADTTAEGTHNASAASEEQLATMEEITASANYLSKLAEELQNLIDQFKV
ncbi:methyl-accepting chemotaxis protein [Paenibacillus mesotrionivorans]|uniref:Methyl-accepting chemotaxis protein n=1 Tax=Paenibacillus mesotrionivorans TaxID=3160968 RepID=A0ACC7P4I2_9BACL